MATEVPTGILALVTQEAHRLRKCATSTWCRSDWQCLRSHRSFVSYMRWSSTCCVYDSRRLCTRTTCPTDANEFGRVCSFLVILQLYMLRVTLQRASYGEATSYTQCGIFQQCLNHNYSQKYEVGSGVADGMDAPHLVACVCLCADA